MAARLYNDPLLHWTIMYINGLSSLTAEWPINELALFDFITKKYGAGHEYDTHHYEKMPEGIWIDNDFCTATYGEDAKLYTNYDYEYAMNEQKRFIKVIKPAYISGFVQAFRNATVAAVSA
jgi:hypothetical protein